MIMILDIGVVAASSIVSEESTNNLYDVIIVGVPELETYKAAELKSACRLTHILNKFFVQNALTKINHLHRLVLIT